MRCGHDNDWITGRRRLRDAQLKAAHKITDAYVRTTLVHVLRECTRWFRRFRSAVVSLQRAVIVPTQRTKCLGAAVCHPLAVVKFLTRGAKHLGAKERHHGRMAVGTSRSQWNKCLGTEVCHRRAFVKGLRLTFLSGIRLLKHVAFCLGIVAAKQLCKHLPVMFRRRVSFRRSFMDVQGMNTVKSFRSELRCS